MIFGGKKRTGVMQLNLIYTKMEEKIKQIAELVRDKDYSFEDLLSKLYLYSLLNEKDLDMLIKFLKMT